MDIVAAIVCVVVSANVPFSSFYRQQAQEEQSWLQSLKLHDT